jgi:tol-pal system protein YbgF
MVIRGPSHTKIPMMRLRFPARGEFCAIKAAAFALALACPMVVPASAQDGGGLFDKIFGGSERMNGGGDRSAPQAAPQDRSAPQAAPQDRSAQMSGSDLVVRLDRLESQIRQLTGIIEQLQYRNQQLEAYVRRIAREDGRQAPLLQEDPGGPRMPRPQTSALPSSPPATIAPGRRGDAFDPAQNPNAPGAPHTLGSINPTAGQPHAPPPVVANAGEPPVGAPGGRGAGAPLDLATMAPPGTPLPGQPPRNPNAGTQVATLPPSQTPRDEFDLAYGYVLRKDYALAEDGFRNFLTKYPNDRLAGDATYWFGETLFQRQRYRDAAEAFLNVSTKFESSAKAPDALLRLGQSLAQLGEKEAACASLGEVVRKFPRASAGVKQGVEREQKRVRC